MISHYSALLKSFGSHFIYLNSEHGSSPHQVNIRASYQLIDLFFKVLETEHIPPH